jgi:hypothetical protein
MLHQKHAFSLIIRTAIDAADLVLVPLPSWRRTTSSRRQRFFLRVVGELSFRFIAV